MGGDRPCTNSDRGASSGEGCTWRTAPRQPTRRTKRSARRLGRARHAHARLPRHLIGFGLCRAWIVFCLGVAARGGERARRSRGCTSHPSRERTRVSLMARWGRAGRDEGFAHSVLIRLTPAALVASGIVIPAGLWMGSAPLTVLGLIAGGAGAGLLQVLWGERFARHPVPFVTLARLQPPS